MLRGQGLARGQSHGGQACSLLPSRPQSSTALGAPTTFPQNPAHVLYGEASVITQGSLLTLGQHVLPSVGQVSTAARGHLCVQSAVEDTQPGAPEAQLHSPKTQAFPSTRPVPAQGTGAAAHAPAALAIARPDGAGRSPHPRARPGTSPTQGRSALLLARPSPMPSGKLILTPTLGTSPEGSCFRGVMVSVSLLLP